MKHVVWLFAISILTVTAWAGEWHHLSKNVHGLNVSVSYTKGAVMRERNCYPCGASSVSNNVYIDVRGQLSPHDYVEINLVTYNPDNKYATERVQTFPLRMMPEGHFSGRVRFPVLMKQFPPAAFSVQTVQEIGLKVNGHFVDFIYADFWNNTVF